MERFRGFKGFLFLILFLPLVVFGKFEDINIIFIHGLNSSSETWKEMASEVSKRIGMNNGSYIEIALDVSILDGNKCWDANAKDEYIDCKNLSDINDKNPQRATRSSAKEHIFGLGYKDFTVNSILWKFNYLPTYLNEKQKYSLENYRVFAINFSHNTQLTYSAQGFQLKKIMDDIHNVTRVGKFILIGHSMGGLAARSYIQDHHTSEKTIKKLITIDSPHLGGTMAGTYNPITQNGGVNLADDSVALEYLNDDFVKDKYNNIHTTFIGYSDNFLLDEEGDYIYPHSNFDGDGSVPIHSQMGLDSLEVFERIVFYPEEDSSYSYILSNNKLEYDYYQDLEDKRVMANYQKESDQTNIDYDYKNVDINIPIEKDYFTNLVNNAHTNILRDEHFIKLIKKLVKPTCNYFSDISDSVYEDYICKVYDRKIVKGYNDETYKPNKEINRAEFIKIVLLAEYSQEEIDTYGKSISKNKYFSDLKEGGWYNNYANFAKRYGFIDGYTDSNSNVTFGGEKLIDFAEASKIIVNCLIRKIESAGEDWYKPYIAILVQKGVKNFDPSKKITRAEMAYIISKAKGF